MPHAPSMNPPSPRPVHVDAPAPMGSDFPPGIQGRAPLVVTRGDHCISRRAIDADALSVLYRLAGHHYDAFLVGGSVRDLLLGRAPKDFDVGTNAQPRDIKRMFRNALIIGRRFKLAHIRFGDGKVIETSTFRKPPEGDPDVSTDLLQHDDNNFFGTPAEDAQRRDFTVNGLFYDIRTFAVVDYVGGLEDLRARRIRAIGDPDTRFREDPIRMLRAVRFASRLDFALEEATRDALLARHGEIAKASAPRLLDEIFRLFGFGASTSAFRLLWTHGLLADLLPEIHVYLGAAGADEAPLWRYLAALDEGDTVCPDATPALMLATLCYDPLVRSMDASAHGPDALAKLGPGRVAEGVQRFFGPMSRRLQIPRRIRERAVGVLLAQGRFDGAGRRRAARVTMAGQDWFPEALALREIHQAAWGMPTEALAPWRLLAAEQADVREARSQAQREAGRRRDFRRERGEDPDLVASAPVMRHYTTDEGADESFGCATRWPATLSFTSGDREGGEALPPAGGAGRKAVSFAYYGSVPPTGSSVPTTEAVVTPEATPPAPVAGTTGQGGGLGHGQGLSRSARRRRNRRLRNHEKHFTGDAPSHGDSGRPRDAASTAPATATRSGATDTPVEAETVETTPSTTVAREAGESVASGHRPTASMAEGAAREAVSTREGTAERLERARVLAARALEPTGALPTAETETEGLPPKDASAVDRASGGRRRSRSASERAKAKAETVPLMEAVVTAASASGATDATSSVPTPRQAAAPEAKAGTRADAAPKDGTVSRGTPAAGRGRRVATSSASTPPPTTETAGDARKTSTPSRRGTRSSASTPEAMPEATAAPAPSKGRGEAVATASKMPSRAKETARTSTEKAAANAADASPSKAKSDTKKPSTPSRGRPAQTSSNPAATTRPSPTPAAAVPTASDRTDRVAVPPASTGGRRSGKAPAASATTASSPSRTGKTPPATTPTRTAGATARASTGTPSGRSAPSSPPKKTPPPRATSSTTRTSRSSNAPRAASPGIDEPLTLAGFLLAAHKPAVADPEPTAATASDAVSDGKRRRAPARGRKTASSDEAPPPPRPAYENDEQAPHWADEI